MSLVAPHGGSLINRVLAPEAAKAAASEAKSLPAITLSPREAFDLEMIAIGAFSPLTGFMSEADFKRVCTEMRLANGTVWPIPVILSPADDVSMKINIGDKVALNDPKGRLLGIPSVNDTYKTDKEMDIPNG